MFLAITRADGGLSIMQLPVGTDVPAEVAKWQTSSGSMGTAVSWRIINPANIPSRRWRNAWTDQGAGPITVDMTRARLLRLRELIIARRVRMTDAVAALQEMQAIPDLATLDTFMPLVAIPVDPNQINPA